MAPLDLTNLTTEQLCEALERGGYTDNRLINSSFVSMSMSRRDQAMYHITFNGEEGVEGGFVFVSVKDNEYHAEF